MARKNATHASCSTFSWTDWFGSICILPLRNPPTSVHLVCVRDSVANTYGLVQIEVIGLLSPAYLSIRAKCVLKSFLDQTYKLVERFRKIMLMVKQPKPSGKSKESDLVIMREGLISIYTI